MNNHSQQLLNYCLDQAKYLLEETLDFDPFAVFIDHNNQLNPLEFDSESKSSPLSGQVIDFLEKACQGEFKSGNIKAYAIACEASIQLDADSLPTDAIAIQITSSEELSLPSFYMPFELKEDEQVYFGEVFAVKS